MSSFTDVVEGLAIFAKYKGADIGADHDVIYVWINEEISDDDRKRVEKLGFFIPDGEDDDTWHRFV